MSEYNYNDSRENDPEFIIRVLLVNLLCLEVHISGCNQGGLRSCGLANWIKLLDLRWSVQNLYNFLASVKHILISTKMVLKEVIVVPTHGNNFFLVFNGHRLGGYLHSLTKLPLCLLEFPRRMVTLFWAWDFLGRNWLLDQTPSISPHSKAGLPPWHARLLPPSLLLLPLCFSRLQVTFSLATIFRV